MNILFVNHLRPQSASFLRQSGLAKELSRLGHTVSLIARQPKDGEQIRLEWGSISYWKEPFAQLIPYNSLKLIELSKKFDVIHVNKAFPSTSLLLSLPKFLAGKPVVMDWEDWDGIGGYIDFARKNLASRFALGFFDETVPRSCEAVICVSKILSRRAAKMGISEDKIFYIPNGYDETLFAVPEISDTLGHKLGLDSRPTVLFVSALHSYEKENFTKIFDAMATVVRAVPDATLAIAGQGEIEAIFRYVEKLGIRKNLAYLGYIPHDEIPQAIARADVAVHILQDNIYFRSSSPMVVPEYMAMGKPIVASQVGELSVMLSDGAGILIKDQTPKVFGEAISSLLGDSSVRQRIGERALARARKYYTYRILAKQAEIAYERAIEKRR